jgi:hypothetical protein
MRRIILIGIVTVLVGVPPTPVRAQDGPTAEEHALLEEVSAVLHGFEALDSYSAGLTYNVLQHINVSMGADSVQLVQTIEANGTADVQQAVAPNQYDNQSIELTETVSQTMTGATNQDQTIGPLGIGLIVVDDHFYFRMEVPSTLAGVIPTGWQDVTDGMDAYPGMSMFNVDSLMEMGGNFPAGYMDALLNATIGVELTAEEMHAGRLESYFTLTLDPAKAFKGIGAGMFESMFNANTLPIDIGKFAEAIFTDEDTTYQIEIMMGREDQQLYALTATVYFDVEIGPDILTDPSMKGMEMTMSQSTQQMTLLLGYNEPLTITAPELGE